MLQAYSKPQRLASSLQRRWAPGLVAPAPMCRQPSRQTCDAACLRANSRGCDLCQNKRSAQLWDRWGEDEKNARIQSTAAEPRREVSGTGSSVKQVNDFHLIPFHVMTHKNVLVTHCCCCLTAIKINAQSLKRWPEKREAERKSACDASSLP